MGKLDARNPSVPAGKAVSRVRVVYGAGVRIGPGKADLLEAIARTGSISAAGRDLGMSYRRAWLLADSLNQMFTEPVVTASAGGSHGGGAGLTSFGEHLLAAYRRAEARSQAIVDEEFGPFEAKLVSDATVAIDDDADA